MLKKFTWFSIFVLWFSTATASALTRIEVAGGWYTDARLDGQYASLIPDSHIVLNGQRLELPTIVIDGKVVKDNVLYLRLTPEGPLKIAGQSHHGAGTWEYSAGLWRIVGPSYGVNAVLYDWSNVLHLGAPQYGSQGLRFARYDNTLVTGDQTYADPALAIWEWTEYLDVRFGQGDAGCIALQLPARYMIERGDCRWVRYLRREANLVVSMVKQVEGKAVVLWLNVGELSTFPPEKPATFPPVDPNPGTNDPNPGTQPAPCSTTTTLDRRLLDVLTIVRARYPRPLPLDEQAARLAKGGILNDTAWQLRQEGFEVDLEDKDGDNTAIQPGTGIKIGNDILQTVEAGVRCGRDVLGATGAGEDATPGLGTKGPALASRRVSPVAPQGTVPTDPPASGEIEKLKAQIVALTAVNAQLTTDNAQLTTAVAAVTAERDALQQRLGAVTCTAKASGPGWVRSLFGIQASCEVVR